MTEKRADNKIVSFKFPTRLIQRGELITGAVLTLIAVLFHLTFMRHAGAFWRDEVGSIVMATMPSITEIWHHLKFDSFPIVPFIVLRLWVNLGAGSEQGLRIFGFLVGLSIIGVLWLNGRLLGYRVPLLSIVLFVFNPCALTIGDAIRPYGVGILLILLFFGLLWKVIEQSRTWQVIVAAIVGVLSVQCLYQNAFFILAAVTAGILVTVRQKRWKATMLLLSIGIVAALSLLPYRQIVKQSYDAAIIMREPEHIPLFWLKLSEAFYVSRWVTLKLWIGLFILGICAYVYSQVAPFGSGITKSQNNLILFCTITALIYAVLFLFFLRSISVTLRLWYYLPLMAVAAIFFDVVLGSLNLWTVIRIVLAIIVAVTTFGASWQTVHMRQTIMDTVASTLEKEVSKNDIIVINPWYFAVGFQRYYHGSAHFTTVPPIDDYKMHRYDLIKAKMAAVDPIQPVLSEISKVLESGNSVWLVGNLNLPPKGNSPKLLPPAPTSPYGWSGTEYATSWGEQLARFILSHSKPVRVLPPVAKSREVCLITKFQAFDKPVNSQDQIEAYLWIIKINPNYAEGYYNLGVFYNRLGHYDNAIKAFKQAVKVKPDYAEAYDSLGILFDQLGRYQDSVEAYQQIIQIKPDDAQAYNNLGVDLGQLDRYQESIQTLKQAMKIRPDFVEAHYNLAITYLMTNDKNSALAEYEILKKLDAEKANMLLERIKK